MFLYKAQTMLAAVAALMATGCGDTEPAAPASATVATPQNLYSNAPTTPNVFRTAEGFVFGLPDDESGLIAWVGLPTDPTDAFECGGDQDFQLTPLQAAGWRQAFNVLAVAKDMNIHVYDINNFAGGTCVAPVIASGTGHMVYTDNDWLNSGPGANAFGLSIHGILTTVPGGERVRVTGQSRALNTTDGSFRFVTSHLSLTPVGRH